MQGSFTLGYRFNLSGIGLGSGTFARITAISFCKTLSGVLSSGILVIKHFLGEVENISGPAPVSDMRTVTDAPVSGVTSLRLLRAH